MRHLRKRAIYWSVLGKKYKYAERTVTVDDYISLLNRDFDRVHRFERCGNTPMTYILDGLEKCKIIKIK